MEAQESADTTKRQGDAGIRAVQGKILEIMKHIDGLCRDNGIVYYIMGGTALGAIRDGGFIPWDDDLDIFMTIDQYRKFKSSFDKLGSDKFVIQEWRTTPRYVEYAKVRMNGTTFIEHGFRNRAGMHHGIYVDIMILHKVPLNPCIQKLVYYECKYVTFYALSQRNWKPKNRAQEVALFLAKMLPNRSLLRACYRRIYRYDGLKDNFRWCYWITKANFEKGLFDRTYFGPPVDILFEDTKLMGSARIKDYLKARYGDYMKLPSAEDRKASVHAEVFDTENGFERYLGLKR